MMYQLRFFREQILQNEFIYMQKKGIRVVFRLWFRENNGCLLMENFRIRQLFYFIRIEVLVVFFNILEF